MTEFVNDPVVQNKFKNIALKTPLFKHSEDQCEGTYMTVCVHIRYMYVILCYKLVAENILRVEPSRSTLEPILLFSQDPMDYIADVL